VNPRLLRRPVARGHAQFDVLMEAMALIIARRQMKLHWAGSGTPIT